MKKLLSLNNAAMLAISCYSLTSLARVDHDVKMRLDNLEAKVEMLEDKVNKLKGCECGTAKGAKEQQPAKASETAHGLKKINTLAELEKVLSEEGVKVFKISTDWCGPCKKIAPYFAEVAKEYEGKVKTYEVNGDNGALFNYFERNYKVLGFPTVITLPSKKAKVGDQAKERYQELYAQALKDYAKSKKAAL